MEGATKPIVTTTHELKMLSTNEGVRREFFEWPLIAKGIGITLVVIGHFHPQPAPAYWLGIVCAIYTFHMPLFFIISGYLFRQDKYTYAGLIENKIRRLLFPYVSVALLLLVIKYPAGLYVKLVSPVTADSVAKLLLDPFNSYLPLLWFVHALFLIFAVYPLLRLIMSNATILSLFLIINLLIDREVLFFGKALSQMPFFVVGVMLREKAPFAKLALNANRLYFEAILLAYVVIQYVIHPIYPPPKFQLIFQFLLGVVGSTLVIWISYALAALDKGYIKNTLMQVGYYSMSIYLLHSPFESMIRIGFLQVFKNLQTPYELIALLAIICGIVFPLLLEKYILRKNAFTKAYLLGLG